MTLVIHWLGGMRLVYTSAQKPWTMSTTIVSPPFWRAAAVITLSSPAALLVFIWCMAKNVSSRVGGLVRIGRSWAAGGDRGNGD